MLFTLVTHNFSSCNKKVIIFSENCFKGMFFCVKIAATRGKKYSHVRKKIFSGNILGVMYLFS